MPPTSGMPREAGNSGPRHRTDADLAIVEAEARYRRERLALYRARVLSAKPTSIGRLRELEREAAAAETRLRLARGRGARWATSSVCPAGRACGVTGGAPATA